MKISDIRRARMRQTIEAEPFNGNSAEFARAVGKPESQINDMLSTPPRKSFGEKVARDICEKLGKPYDYFDNLSPLTYSKGVISAAQSFSNVEAAPDVKGRIPLISWVQAGMWNDSVDMYEPGYAERWLPFLKNNGEKTFALRVVGDSMTARFGKSYPDGCIIFVDPEQRTPTNGDRIVAKLEGSEEVTFKVFTQDAGRIWLRPLNDMHPPIHDAFTVIGKVVGKWEDE